MSLLLLVVLHVDRCPHEDTQWEERTIKYMKECNVGECVCAGVMVIRGGGDEAYTIWASV